MGAILLYNLALWIWQWDPVRWSNFVNAYFDTFILFFFLINFQQLNITVCTIFTSSAFFLLLDYMQNFTKTWHDFAMILPWFAMILPWFCHDFAQTIQWSSHVHKNFCSKIFYFQSKNSLSKTIRKKQKVCLISSLMTKKIWRMLNNPFLNPWVYILW